MWSELSRASFLPSYSPALGAAAGALGLACASEGIELTLYLGKFTHAHFSPFNYDRPVARYADDVVDRIVAFLDLLFSDQVEFWGNDGRGGWQTTREADWIAAPGARQFV